MLPTTSYPITDHFIGPQHPFLGIDPRRCQRQLTLANWQESGILVGDSYLFISSAFQAKGRVKGYCVNCWSAARAAFISQTFFVDLHAAIDHANSLVQAGSIRCAKQLNGHAYESVSLALTAPFAKT